MKQIPISHHNLDQFLDRIVKMGIQGGMTFEEWQRRSGLTEAIMKYHHKFDFKIES